MKARYILLIIIFLVATVILWNEQKDELETHDIIYQHQLVRDLGFITILMYDSLPDTFDLYENNFTENELRLFKSSLGNIILALSTKPTDLGVIERLSDNNHNLSKSVENFSELMFEIKENAGDIDEEVFYQMSDIIPKYGKELEEMIYRTSLENIIEQGPKLLNEMNREIQDLVKLDSHQ